MKTLLEEKEQLLRQHDRAVKNNLLLSFSTAAPAGQGLPPTMRRCSAPTPRRRAFGLPASPFRTGDAARAGSLESRSLMKYCLTELLGKAFQTYRLHIADVNWNQTAVILHGGLEDGAGADLPAYGAGSAGGGGGISCFA